MKPAPNLNDTDAMILRGKRSVLGSARLDASEALRDACSHLQGAEWHEVPRFAATARYAAERLLTLAAMWDEVHAG